MLENTLNPTYRAMVAKAPFSMTNWLKKFDGKPKEQRSVRERKEEMEYGTY